MKKPAPDEAPDDEAWSGDESLASSTSVAASADDAASSSASTSTSATASALARPMPLPRAVRHIKAALKAIGGGLETLPQDTLACFEKFRQLQISSTLLTQQATDTESLVQATFYSLVFFREAVKVVALVLEACAAGSSAPLVAAGMATDGSVPAPTASDLADLCEGRAKELLAIARKERLSRREFELFLKNVVGERNRQKMGMAKQALASGGLAALCAVAFSSNWRLVGVGIAILALTVFVIRSTLARQRAEQAALVPEVDRFVRGPLAAFADLAEAAARLCAALAAHARARPPGREALEQALRAVRRVEAPLASAVEAALASGRFALPESDDEGGDAGPEGKKGR